MTAKQRDLLTAGILFVFAIAWTSVTVLTIPGGSGPGDIGARGFPLTLGVALIILTFSLGAKTLLAHQPDETEESDNTPTGTGRTATAILLVLGHLVAYAFLMERIGFLLSTIVIAISMMAISLRERSVVKIIVFSVGTSVVAWLVFAKLMGVYLPSGTLITFG